MLIREKKLPKNQVNHQLNEDTSREGKAKFAEGEQLQANVQGSLSDLVREHDKQVANDPKVMEDETFNKEWEQSLANWNDGIGEKHGGKSPITQRKRVGVIRAGGGYVSLGKKK